MLPHILKCVSLVILGWSGTVAASVQDSIDGCIPDSVLFGGNTKWWYPGEPLNWARPGLLDSLLNQNLDGFNLTVESPRIPGYNKVIRYIRFGPKDEVMYVEGDCRFISYDPINRVNHSSSIVVGHTYYASPFWWNGSLHFQNGFSNWHVHDHQLWHSRETGELHQTKLPQGPDQIGFAAVHASDSGLYFTRIDNDLELKREGQGVYFLHHGRHAWEYLGVLNPVFGSEFTRYVLDTKSYWVFRTKTTLLLRRKSDGYGAMIATDFGLWNRLTRSKAYIERGTAWRDNSLFLWQGPELDSINLDTLAVGAQWLPFFIPSAESDQENRNTTEQPLPPWLVGLLGFSIAVMIMLWRQNDKFRKSSALTIVASDELPPLSMETRNLLTYSGQNLNSAAFDAACGIGNVDSPETKRSRRSNIIKMVNAECMARFGAPLIHRERLPTDKRVIVYRIHTFESVDGA